MKRIIKKLLTIFYHPIVSVIFYFKGFKDFTIGPRMQINSFKYISGQRGIAIGRDSRFMFVGEYCGQSYNPYLKIGKAVSIGNRFTALCGAPIVLEDNCLIASDVLITSENHGTNPEAAESYSQIPLSVAPVTIGAGTWIGEKVSIMPGVCLGERCIVGAGAVVTRSFPAYCMIGGIPARVLKQYDTKEHAWVKATA